MLLFNRWMGGDAKSLPWAETYGKSRSVVAGEGGELSFAEIEIVKRLRGAGWEGGWLDTFGAAPVRWRPWMVTLHAMPSNVRTRYYEIHTAANRAQGKNGTGGRPDVIAWRERSIVFLESKGPGDRIKPAQEAWASCAVESDHDGYGVVYWTFRAESGTP